jgi:hypothetical protein
MNIFASGVNAVRAAILGTLFILFGSGCATAEGVHSKEAIATIEIMKDGTVKIFAANGQQVKACKLCTEEACGNIDPKDKEAIKRLTDAGYCTALLSATTIAPHLDLSVQQTRVNPYCQTYYVNGTPHQICYCAPGEHDPRCINQ